MEIFFIVKKRIISISRRTDIPAFYSPWFMNRIKAGYCVYPNPLYPNKFYRVSLLPQDVLGMAFWTRHAAPLIPRLAELDSLNFTYYFNYTVIGYPQTLDLRSPSLDVSIKTFKLLSERIGPNRIIWRYDPIILNKEISEKWHHDNFRRIADAISQATKRVVVSVIDPYARTQRRVGTAENGVLYNPESYIKLLQTIVYEAQQRGLSIQSCAESSLHVEGIVPGSCVDAKLIYSLSGRQIPERLKLHKQREGCLCNESTDIGVTDSCGFGCLYCYATKSHEKALATLRSHNPDWTCISQNIHIDAPISQNHQPKLPIHF